MIFHKTIKNKSKRRIFVNIIFDFVVVKKKEINEMREYQKKKKKKMNLTFSKSYSDLPSVLVKHLCSFLDHKFV